MKKLRFVSDRQKRLAVIFLVVLVVVLSSLFVAAKSGANRANASSTNGERTSQVTTMARSRL